ncbi:hypothetical protein HYU45_05015 [Candidatus Daviesbacteria bacterium]|nr:hypothetical protein [Candidatus Daviesbacteria bacterium]
MRGFRVWGLATSKIIALFFVFFVFLYPIPYTLYPTYAADSTPSADIKAKLEELKKEIASKAAKLKQEVNHKLKDKAYTGMVKASSETSLTLAAASGPKIISINQDTVFESKIKGKTKFSLKAIAEDDYIAALGDIDETGVLTAKKIILLPTPNLEPKTYFWGQVISISDELITLKDKNFQNVAVSLPTSATVKLKDFVILTGSKNKNEIFEAGFVYVIPQGGIIKPKKVATQSATPTGKKK